MQPNSLQKFTARIPLPEEGFDTGQDFIERPAKGYVYGDLAIGRYPLNIRHWAVYHYPTGAVLCIAKSHEQVRKALQAIKRSFIATQGYFHQHEVTALLSRLQDRGIILSYFTYPEYQVRELQRLTARKELAHD